MEKVTLPDHWQNKFDDIWNSIPESDGPDMDVMDKALEKLMELVVMLAGELTIQENVIKSLQTTVVGLDISKELIDQANAGSENGDIEDILYS